MPPPSQRLGLNSTVPLAMAPSGLRTAHPVFWPRSSAKIAPPVKSPEARAAAGTEIALASLRSARRVDPAMIVPSRVILVRMAAGSCQVRRRHPLFARMSRLPADWWSRGLSGNQELPQ
jgi:hypothetical protein